MRQDHTNNPSVAKSDQITSGPISGKIEVGESYEYRITLGFLAIGVAGLFTLAYLLAYTYGVVDYGAFRVTSQDRPGIIVLMSLLVLLLILARRARVILDDAGIRSIVFRERLIHWSEVASVSSRGLGIDVRTRQGHTEHIPSRIMSCHRGYMEYVLPCYLSRFARGDAGVASRTTVGLREPDGILLWRFWRSMPVFVYDQVRLSITGTRVSVAAFVVACLMGLAARCVPSLRFLESCGFVPLLFLLTLTTAGTCTLALSFRVRRALTKTHRHMCWTCGYDLRGLPGTAVRCPECGTEVDFKSLHEKWAPLKRFIHRNDDGE